MYIDEVIAELKTIQEKYGRVKVYGMEGFEGGDIAPYSKDTIIIGKYDSVNEIFLHKEDLKEGDKIEAILL